MSAVKLTEENIILSRWNSQGRLSKTISLGLIFGYLLGLLYGRVMPVSSETCKVLFLWPGTIVFFVVTVWLAAVTVSIICALFSRKWTLRDDAICVLLPTLIAAFFFVLYYSILSEAKEEETGIRPRIHDSSDEQKQRKEEIIVGNVEENLKGMLKKGE